MRVDNEGVLVPINSSQTVNAAMPYGSGTNLYKQAGVMPTTSGLQPVGTNPNTVAPFVSSTGGGTGTTTPTTPPPATKNVNPAFDAVLATLNSYGMAGVQAKMEEIRTLYPDISTADLLTMLQYDKRYNQPYLERFAGNAQLMAKGFTPLDPKTYIANEQAYTKTFNAYGLSQFVNKDSFAKLIGGNVSPDEANTRVSMAFDRVLNDKATLNAFNKFYPTVKTSDIAATLLDPNTQMPALQRQVTAAEIGGQALQQGLQASLLATSAQPTAYSNVKEGTMGAQELANMGITKAQAAKGYQAIAEVVPTAEKLSSIYAGVTDQYGQLQAEQEQFQGLASATRKRQQLGATEQAAFSGSSGAQKGAFSTNYLSKTSSAGLI